MAKYQIGGGYSKEAASDGVWTSDFGPELKIAHAENMQFKKTMERLYRPFKNKDVPVEKRDDLFLKAMSEALLVDWKKGDIEDSEGKALPYSPENAYTLLRADPELRDFVSSYAGRIANFKAEALEERVGK